MRDADSPYAFPYRTTRARAVPSPSTARSPLCIPRPPLDQTPVKRIEKAPFKKGVHLYEPAVHRTRQASTTVP